VLGAGGVGVSIVQLARARGASQIIAVDLASDKLDAAIRAGATAVVDAGEQDAVEAVRDLTGGRGEWRRSSRRSATRRRSARRPRWRALDSVIIRSFPLEQADEAYGMLARGEIVGRAIIEMAGSATR